MDTSPITNWDGAGAYFTYAGSSAGVTFWLIVAAAIVVASIGYGMRHEGADFRKHARNE